MMLKLDSDRYLSTDPNAWERDARRSSSEKQHHLKTIREHHRLLVQLFAEGMSNEDIVVEFASRGIDISHIRVRQLRTDPLIQKRVSELQSLSDAKCVGRIEERRTMAYDALRVLHMMAMGVVERPELGEDGKPTHATRYEHVPTHTMASAAKTVVSTCEETAPVQRRRELSTDALDEEDVKELRERMLAARQELGTLHDA